VEDLGATFHHVIGDDVSSALLDFARGVNATQVVLGVSRRRGWQYVFGPGVGATVARESGPDLDVHLITHDEAGKGRGLPVARGARLGRPRIISGWLAGVAGPTLLTLLLTNVDAELGLANDMLLTVPRGVCRLPARQPVRERQCPVVRGHLISARRADFSHHAGHCIDHPHRRATKYLRRAVRQRDNQDGQSEESTTERPDLEKQAQGATGGAWVS
jgi:hypothetical protein